MKGPPQENRKPTEEGSRPQDPEVATLKTSNAKMRLRTDFDAKKRTSGYRDIQLSVQVRTPASFARGVEHHIAEVQLHLEQLFKLKTASGHRTYVSLLFLSRGFRSSCVSPPAGVELV